MTLRPYQLQALDRVLAALPNRPVLVMPTGAGKTVTAVALVRRLGVPTLWIAHRTELIDQACRTFADHGMDTIRVQAGFKGGASSYTAQRIYVASVQTLVRRAKPPAELVITDEAHHVVAGSYRKVINCYPDAWHVGLTATPFRLDGAGLGDTYGEMVVATTTRELCDSGVLHAPRVWASRSPDLRGVRVISGDYSVGALAERSNTDALRADIVQTWKRIAAGKRTVAFGVDVQHSQAIAAAFVSAGVPAEHIDGKTPRDVREASLARLRSSHTLVIANCGLLPEGWDLPELECAILGRSTLSLCLHLQQIGRVMRAADGKAGAIVLDHAGNHHVHGLVTRRLTYSLDGGVSVESEPLGLTRCRGCGLLYDVDASACPECGWVPPPMARDRFVDGAGELDEFAETFDYRRDVWNLLEAEREAAGYAAGWSWFRFRERFGVKPVLGEIDGRAELIDTKTATRDERAAVYRRLARIAAEKGFRSGWVSNEYRRTFGVWPSGFVGRERLAAFSERLKARVT